MKKLLVSVMVIFNTLLLASQHVFAAGGPGVNFGSWLQDQAKGIFVGAMAIIGLALLIMRKTTMLIVVAIFGGVGAWLIYSPDAFANTIKTIIQGGFGA